MFRTFVTLLLVASVTLLSRGARAADTESPRRCAEIASDTYRLACYDRLFAPTDTEHAKSSSAAPAAAAVGEETRRDFGLSEAAKQRNGNNPTAPDSISVTIQSTSRRPTGEQVFQTNEGQTWVEIEPSARARVEPGETVTIREAALGSYMLVTSGRVGTKVRRVK